jgi:hemerythrin-like domain-containing protein
VKRHPHLVPLSDDHHNALVLARRSRRAGERPETSDDLTQIWDDVRRRFTRELDPHFRVEEKWLLPQLASAGETALVERTLADHARLRELVAAPPTSERMVAFGNCLHAHVRFEERELFARAEAVLSPSALETVGRAALEMRSRCAR